LIPGGIPKDQNGSAQLPPVARFQVFGHHLRAEIDAVREQRHATGHETAGLKKPHLN